MQLEPNIVWEMNLIKQLIAFKRYWPCTGVSGMSAVNLKYLEDWELFIIIVIRIFRRH
jgi:hypothetical protein